MKGMTTGTKKVTCYALIKKWMRLDDLKNMKLVHVETIQMGRMLKCLKGLKNSNMNR